MSQGFGYPAGWKLRLAIEQATAYVATKELRTLDISHVDKLLTLHKKNGRVFLPDGFDGLAVFPKLSTLARLAVGNEDWPVYNRALAHTFAMLKVHRSNFVDFTEGRIGPDHERLTALTSDAFKELEKLPGDVIVLPVQTGMLHSGESVQDACASFDGQEFGLDSVSCGNILLIHPERLTKYTDLAMDCPGSERSPEADGQFFSVPSYSFYGKTIDFDASDVVDADPGFGSASAFLLK